MSAPRSDRLARLLLPRPSLCSALDPAVQPQLADLNSRMAAFYNGPERTRYFASVDVKNAEWTPRFKAHLHLRSAIPQGSYVVDLGCGSAHPCEHLRDRLGRYTGVDWTEEQMVENRRRWPQHEFLTSSLYDVSLPAGAAEVVMSLFAIEHCVWPHRLLDEMVRLARPGGLLAILTPPFRARSYLKSFPYGLSARPLAEKLRSLSVVDVLWHVYHHRVYYPAYLGRHYPRRPGVPRFLIHLRPVALTSGTWFPDADAVYVSDTAEMRDYLHGLGADLVTHWPSWGYLLMRKKPDAASPTSGSSPVSAR